MSVISDLIKKDMIRDISELHKALMYMYMQHKCGCGNPACNRCYDDSDNGELLHRIGKKYHDEAGWED